MPTNSSGALSPQRSRVGARSGSSSPHRTESGNSSLASSAHLDRPGDDTLRERNPRKSDFSSSKIASESRLILKEREYGQENCKFFFTIDFSFFFYSN